MKKLLSLLLLAFLIQFNLNGQESKQVTIPQLYYLDQVIQIGEKGYLMIMSKGTYQKDQGTMRVMFFSPENEQKWETTINKHEIDDRYEAKKVNVLWSDNFIYLTSYATDGKLTTPQRRIVVFQLEIQSGKINRGAIPVLGDWGEVSPIGCTDGEIQVVRKISKSISSADSTAKFIIQHFDCSDFRGDEGVEIEFPSQKPGKKWQTWIYMGKYQEYLAFYKKYYNDFYQIAIVTPNGKLHKELFLHAGIEKGAEVIGATSSHYNQEFVPYGYDVWSHSTNDNVIYKHAIGSYTDVYLDEATNGIYITGKFSSPETSKNGAFFFTKYDMDGKLEWHKKLLNINYKFPIFSYYDFYIVPNSKTLRLSLSVNGKKRKLILDEYNFNSQGDSTYACRVTARRKTEKNTVKTLSTYYYSSNPSIKNFYSPEQLNAFTSLEQSPDAVALLKAKELAQTRTEEDNPFYYVMNLGNKHVIVEHLTSHDKINLYSVPLK